MWEIETIPDSDLLFRRISKSHCDGEEVLPIAFKDLEMSTDWSLYCKDPNETKQRATEFDRDPDKYGVIYFCVKEVRNIPSQSVNHAPSLKNRAHTNIVGVKDTKIRLLFLDIFNWVIPCSK